MHPLAWTGNESWRCLCKELLREVRVTRVGEKEMPPRNNHLKRDLENKEKSLGSTGNQSKV